MRLNDAQRGVADPIAVVRNEAPADEIAEGTIDGPNRVGLRPAQRPREVRPHSSALHWSASSLERFQAMPLARWQAAGIRAQAFEFGEQRAKASRDHFVGHEAPESRAASMPGSCPALSVSPIGGVLFRPVVSELFEQPPHLLFEAANNARKRAELADGAVEIWPEVAGCNAM